MRRKMDRRRRAPGSGTGYMGVLWFTQDQAQALAGGMRGWLRRPCHGALLHGCLALKPHLRRRWDFPVARGRKALGLFIDGFGQYVGTG